MKRRPIDTKLGRALYPVLLVGLAIWIVGMRGGGLDTWWAWVAFGISLVCLALSFAALSFERPHNGDRR